MGGVKGTGTGFALQEVYELLKGEEPGIDSVSRLTPEQQRVFSNLLKDFDPKAMTDMFQTSVANPTRQEFQEKTLPGIQERFIAGGGSRSGALNRAGTQAGANMESSLSGQLAKLLSQGQESSYDRQAKLATTPTLEMYQRDTTSPLAQILGPLVQGATTAMMM